MADRLDRDRTTGVGTYVNGLTQGLESVDGGHDFVLFAPEGSPLRKAAWTLLGTPDVRPPREPDLLHVLVPTMPVPTHLPLVVTIHDLMPLKYPSYFAPRARWLYGRAMRQFRRQAAHVIAVSEATAADVERLLSVPAERITVAHEGEPLDLASPAREAVEPALRAVGLRPGGYLMFLGELARRKNPLGLVEAFGRVAAEFPELRLAFVGSPGIGADDVRARVGELGLGDRVDFLGHVPRGLIASLFAGAAAVVLPSEDEGFGIPAVEAMTCGAPLIVSDRGALPEVVGDGGVVVPFGDVDALASAVRRAVQEPGERAQLAERGRRRAGAFSWRRAAEITVDVYHRTLGARA
jgi:glycosyltransferase involved in cell wall biosynthesis